MTKQFGVDISESGLAQRMNAAGAQLLKGLIQTAISKLAQQVTRDEQLFTSFSAVNIVDISPVKAFQLFQRAMPALIRHIAAGWEKAAARLVRFVEKLARFAQKSSRPNCPATRQALLREGI